MVNLTFGDGHNLGIYAGKYLGFQIRGVDPTFVLGYLPRLWNTPSSE